MLYMCPHFIYCHFGMHQYADVNTNPNSLPSVWPSGIYFWFPYMFIERSLFPMNCSKFVLPIIVCSGNLHAIRRFCWEWKGGYVSFSPGNTSAQLPFHAFGNTFGKVVRCNSRERNHCSLMPLSGTSHIYCHPKSWDLNEQHNFVFADLNVFWICHGLTLLAFRVVSRVIMLLENSLKLYPPWETPGVP